MWISNFGVYSVDPLLLALVVDNDGALESISAVLLVTNLCSGSCLVPFALLEPRVLQVVS